MRRFKLSVQCVVLLQPHLGTDSSFKKWDVLFWIMQTTMISIMDLPCELQRGYISMWNTRLLCLFHYFVSSRGVDKPYSAVLTTITWVISYKSPIFISSYAIRMPYLFIATLFSGNATVISPRCRVCWYWLVLELGHVVQKSVKLKLRLLSTSGFVLHMLRSSDNISKPVCYPPRTLLINYENTIDPNLFVFKPYTRD